MSLLIVGCGYLGRRVAEVLVDRHEPIYGTTRSASRARELESLGIVPVIADVLDPTSLAALPFVDRVLYCVGFDRAANVSLRTVYVEGLNHALAALAGRTGRVVFTSSTGIYGRADGGWVSEETPPEPSTESGKVMLEAEESLSTFCPRASLDYGVIRFSGLYGPERIIRRAALEKGEPIAGDPNKYLNLIHVFDIESGVLRRSFDWNIGGIQAIAIAPDGLTAAAGAERGIIVWDLDE